MIYLDNAATSYPKPEPVIQAVERCLREAGANPGRGAHKLALEAGRLILETRESLAEFFNIGDSSHLIFTASCTEALNLALKGFLRSGDHVMTTSVEHNSVTRPLFALKGKGVSTTKVPCAPNGSLDILELEKAIRPNTRLVAVTAASNVIGALLPLKEISEVVKKHKLIFLVDAAQIAGHRRLDVRELGINLMAFPGHKGLFGPQGTGGLYIDPELELEELKQGGTGGQSESQSQPLVRPERYESGTINTPGVAGLGAGVKLIKELGLKEIAAKEESLVNMLVEGLAEIPGITLYGPPPGASRASVVSVNVSGLDSSQFAFILDQQFDIAVRPGLHCSPDAHETLGTSQTGAVRFSPGYFNTVQDIDGALMAVKSIAKEFALV